MAFGTGAAASSWARTGKPAQYTKKSNTAINNMGAPQHRAKLAGTMGLKKLLRGVMYRSHHPSRCLPSLVKWLPFVVGSIAMCE